MGWASYLEKVREIREEAISLRERLGRSPEPEPRTAIEMQSLADEASLRIKTYRGLLKQIIAHVDQLLEVATDPAVNLAEEVRQLRVERDSVLAELQHLRTKRDFEAAELQQLRVERDSEAAKLGRLRAATGLTLEGLRKKLKASEAAHTNAVKSTKGELARQKDSYEGKIDEIEKRHRKELDRVKIASRIENTELRKKVEKGATKANETKDTQQSREEDFAVLLPRYSSPRVPNASQHDGKRKPLSGFKK
jgi:hypothetical protein